MRAEFFNIINQVVFGGPSANLNAPATFGRIGGQANAPPKLLQFGEGSLRKIAQYLIGTQGGLFQFTPGLGYLAGNRVQPA